MNAVVFDGELRFIKDYPVPEPSGNEALIRVLMAGICATDLEIIKGYKGYKGILGHEFVGVVEKMHGHDTSLIGKRVVGEINIGCGSCDYCIQGLGNHCLNRKVLGIQDKDGAL
ncbi:MAG: alcohol dehydrogenase catalytic domain-containing protein, partial [bacterium]